MTIQPKLTLVGAGPGDPDLITVRGASALASADVVLYDALANRELLTYARRGVPKVFVGKRRGEHAYTQDEINALLVEYALLYGNVVRLKGGDPFVFGRGFEELEYAARYNVPGEYVPGISSAIAVPGILGMPVTSRGASESFWVIAGTTASGEVSRDLHIAASVDATVVILMGAGKLHEIVEVFALHGRHATPAAIIQNGSLPDARFVTGTVESIASAAEEEGIGSPAVIVIGKVVRLAELCTIAGSPGCSSPSKARSSIHDS